jgi:TolB-like protein/Tfp pilus assembly protein PilF
MSSLLPGFEYDIFISYRHKDNKYDGWVSEFVANLKKELEATFKDDISIYFDENPHDGLLETHNVDKSLEGKLKCLIFIPIISQTYCDPRSFAWKHEFLIFNRMAKEDQFGSEVKLSNGNVASRVLPVRIHDINAQDKALIENELGPLRSIDFILKSAGINRPLTSKDDEVRTHGQILYRNQINKVANALKEIIYGLETCEANSTEKLPKSTPHRSLIEQRIKPSTQKILAICAGILLLFLIAGYFIFNYTSIGAKFLPVSLDKSIAILPFKNISQDTDEYFSDGMTVEVINYLAKVGDLKVISQTSIGQYKGVKKDIRTIANELGVSYILEGSVRKAGNTFRISVQLIEAETGFHLWSDEYDREITDVLQVQSNISKEITDVLKIVLTESERKNIENAQQVELTAYDFYLKGRRELMNYIANPSKGQGYLENAIGLFKNAIAGDPTFARAYSGLGQTFGYKFYRSVYTDKTSLDSVKMLADMTLQLDDKTDEGHYLRGVYFHWTGNNDGAIFEFKRALEINPNYVDAMILLGSLSKDMNGDFVTALPQMHRAIQLGRGPELAYNLRWIGGTYFEIGLFDKGEEFVSNAVRLDKDSSSLFVIKSWRELINQHYQSALWLANKAYQSDSSNVDNVDQKAWVLTLLGRYQEALDTWQSWINNNDTSILWNRHRVGYLYWVLGDKKKAYANFNRMIEIGEEHIKLNSPYAQSKFAYYDLAGVYAFLGEKKKANQYLEEVSKRAFFHCWMIELLKVDPLFEKIREEDRFRKIVLQMEQKSNADRNRVIKWFEKEAMKATAERY